MPIFTVIATEAPEPVKAALKSALLDHIEVAQNVWLVAGNGIAKDISDQLGITQGQNGTGFVFAISGYYGYASNAVWEWLALKQRGGWAT